MKQLRVGVVGLGMGFGHAKAFKEDAHSELVALADTDKNRLDTRAKELGVSKRYLNAEEMIAKEKLDLVCVATPNKFHAPLTIAAVQSGAHVLCEKPMAMNAAEAAQMLDAADKANRRILINFSSRFTPQTQFLKMEVDSGSVGDIFFGRTVWLRRRGMPKFGGWFGQKELSGGGPLIDLGVHRLDLALWLMGFPKPVWAMGSTYDHYARPLAKREGKAFDVEDMAVGMIRFDNGAVLELEASWASHIKERELMETRLLGTKGGLVQRNLNEGYEFEAKIYTERNGIQYNIAPNEPLPPHKGAAQYFTECIVEDKPHFATGQEGLVVMQILDAIYESARTGAPVKF